MAAPLKAAGHRSDPASLADLSIRLLQRSMAELIHIDRPVARLAAERCTQHLAAAGEHFASAVAFPPAARAQVLQRALHHLVAARFDLELLQTEGNIVPTAARSLLAGIEVLRRKGEELTPRGS